VWKSTEQSYVKYIENTKRVYGDDFFEVTENPVELEMFNMINEIGRDRKASFFERIRSRKILKSSCKLYWLALRQKGKSVFTVFYEFAMPNGPSR